MPYSKGFNPKNLDTLRKQLTDALKEIDPSLTFKIGKMTFSDGEVGMSLTSNIIGLPSKQDQDLIRYSKLHNFNIDEEKVLPGLGLCKLIAFKSRNTKKPWIVSCQTGNYKIEHEKIEAVWGGNN